MKGIALLRIGFLWIQVCLMTGCGPIGRAENDWRSPDEVLVLENICELYEDPDRFHAKKLKIHTTLYRMGTVRSFGDERCIQRHPLIDVEFTQQFFKQPCDGESELCSAISTINKTSLTFEITAEFTGSIHARPSDNEFNVGGKRFVFVTDGMKNLGKVKVINTEKP